MIVHFDDKADVRETVTMPWESWWRPYRAMRDGLAYDQVAVLPDGSWIYRSSEARPAPDPGVRIVLETAHGCAVAEVRVQTVDPVVTHAGHAYRYAHSLADGRQLYRRVEEM